MKFRSACLRASVLAGLAWASTGAAHAQPEEASLDEILTYAETHAPLLLEARARLEEGVAAQRGASPLLRDGLAVTLAGGPRFLDGGPSDYDVLVALSQPIELAGERGTRMDAADRLMAQREAELEEVQWQVHREIHVAYHHGIHDRVRVETEELWIQLAEEVLRIATARAAVGEAPDVERVIALAEVARARQRRLVALTEYETAILTLAEVAGWDPTRPPAPIGDLDEPHELPADAQLLALALEHQPRVRAAAAAVATARAELAREDRRAFPTLDVGLQFSREGSAGSPSNFIGLLVLGVSLPIWQQNTAARADASAALSVAEAEEQAVRAVVQARVLRVASTVRRAAERLRLYERDVLPGFQEALTGLTQAYEIGEIDLAMLSEGRRSFLEVQSDAIDAYVAYHDALGQLETELGAEVDTAERDHVAPPTGGVE